MRGMDDQQRYRLARGEAYPAVARLEQAGRGFDAAVDRAPAGDTAALRLAPPRKDSPVLFALPRMAVDASGALLQVLSDRFGAEWFTGKEVEGARVTDPSSRIKEALADVAGVDVSGSARRIGKVLSSRKGQIAHGLHLTAGKSNGKDAVQVAQRWILARLRNRRFFSLAELNAAIRQLRDELNMRVMRGYGASRADLFATMDRPYLQPLPQAAYTFARWKRARVALDYHVEMESSWYSVPFGLIREEVDVRISGDIVEIFHKGQRVASHLRCPGRRSHVTLPDHKPSAHRRHAEWTPARMLVQAAKLGPSVTAFCEAVMTARPHPEQGFRTCLGVPALAKSYDATRLDATCRRGLTIQTRSVASIRSILKNGLDRAFLEDRPKVAP